MIHTLKDRSKDFLNRCRIFQRMIDLNRKTDFLNPIHLGGKKLIYIQNETIITKNMLHNNLAFFMAISSIIWKMLCIRPLRTDAGVEVEKGQH